MAAEQGSIRRKWNRQGVKRLRRRLGFTQKELAFELGISPPSVSAWEMGYHYPSSICARLLNLLADGHLPRGRIAALLGRVE